VVDDTLRMPEVGEIAPDIDRDATGDGRFRLVDQRGKWVVVYFFPRANTPG
jgi:peroxiredoxin Q/BCP